MDNVEYKYWLYLGESVWVSRSDDINMIKCVKNAPGYNFLSAWDNWRFYNRPLHTWDNIKELTKKQAFIAAL